MSDKFKYNYSAPTPSQRREIEQIRNKYLVEKKEITKLSELKKIDNKVQSIKTSIALVIGIIGTLTFGTGMVFFLEWTNLWYLGIPFFIIGLIMVIANYPIYLLISNHLRNKYRDKILKLSTEILEEEK